MTTQKKVQVCTVIPIKLFQKLEQKSITEDRSVSSILRYALKQYLDTDTDTTIQMMQTLQTRQKELQDQIHSLKDTVDRMNRGRYL